MFITVYPFRSVFITVYPHAGQLTASVRGPTKQIPVALDDVVPGKPSIIFTPQEEGELKLLGTSYRKQHC